MGSVDRKPRVHIHFTAFGKFGDITENPTSIAVPQLAKLVLGMRMMALLLFLFFFCNIHIVSSAN
jgi:hypothetical protein